MISIQKIEKVRTFKYLEITASDMDIEINEIPLYFCTHDPVIRKKYRMYVSKSPSEHIFFKTLHLPIERLLLTHPLTGRISTAWNHSVMCFIGTLC